MGRTSLTWQVLTAIKDNVIGNDVLFDTIFKGRLKDVTIEGRTVTLEFEWIAIKDDGYHLFQGFSDNKVVFDTFSDPTQNVLWISPDGQRIRFAGKACSGHFYLAPQHNLDPNQVQGLDEPRESEST